MNRSSSGIYQIVNKLDLKRYIGSASVIKDRISNHKQSLRRDAHRNRYLQRAYNKYGENNFIFQVIEYCNKADLIKKEQWYIDFTECCNPQKGYNIIKTASSNLGHKWSEEAKAKIKGRVSLFRGIKRPIEHVKKAMEARALVAHKIDYSNVVKHHKEHYSGSGNPMFGKISAMKGKTHTQESREKIRIANTGIVFSDERKRKISES